MARGRPATPLGTWGTINTRQLDSGTYSAETRLRLHNGDTVRIRARGRSKTAAANNLKAKCVTRLGETDTDTLTTTSTVKALLDHWLPTKKNLRPQSRDRYRDSIDLHIVPAFGNMRLNEVTPAFLNTWLHAQAPGVAPNVRTVLKGAFQMATRYGLMPADPMAVVEPLATGPKEVRALEVDEIQPFRDVIRAYGNETLTDVVDFSIATGLRAGEVLALRWEDLDLEHEPPLMAVTGTLAYSKERGNIRQEEAKTAAGDRVIQLPAVAVEIITRRQAKYGLLEMVFPSGAGTYLWENNFNRWLRAARGEGQWKWVTIHSLRKTLGSIVADELGPHKAADVLGHADSGLTERVYYMRNRKGVAIGAVVDEVIKVSKKCPNNSDNPAERQNQTGPDTPRTSNNRTGRKTAEK